MIKARSIKRVVPVVIITAGVAVAASLIATKPELDITSDASQGRLVRTFRAVKGPHRIAVSAYGTSRAANEWAAIAEVAGRITMLDDAFEEGEIVQAGALVATIDKLDYELAAKTAQTQVAAQDIQQLELVQTKANIESVITLREQQLEFAKSELDRIQELLKRGAGTKADYDRVSSAYLDRQASLRDLQNRLAIIPIQEQSLSIAKEAAQLRLQQAERDVERCEIRLPFTALCLSREIALHQQAAAGQQLGRFLALERAEIVAMVEPRRALVLFPNLGESIGPIDLSSQTMSLVNEIRRRFDVLNIPVDVTWRAGEGHAQWRGRLARASATIDEATRSIPLIIEVEDAFTAVKIGVKPALVPGMFVEVVIYGDVLDDVYVVPRDVVREGSVFVVREDRLAIVPVHVIALEEEVAVIDSGLKDDDQVVLADLFPAANGMRLRVEETANPVTPRLKLPKLTTQRTVTP